MEAAWGWEGREGAPRAPWSLPWLPEPCRNETLGMLRVWCADWEPARQS